MTYPHHSMGYPTDAPVRPGTSDALTARTIDATVHPPLVRAQETVVALGPRIAESVAPLASPVLIGLLLVTLVFAWVAHRLRYRPSALVLSALLVMGLTSFRPMQKWEQPRTRTALAKVRPRTLPQGARNLGWSQDQAQPIDRYQVPTPMVPDVAINPPDYPTNPPDNYGPPEPVQVVVPPDFGERLPEWGRDAMENAERIVRQNRQLQQIMQELRHQLREQARRERWRQMRTRYRAHEDFDPMQLVLTR
jgi:hypothetical protein